MISIIKATQRDCNAVVSIGKVAIAESHQDSCSAEEMYEFLEKNYNCDAIKKELNDIDNIYYLIHYKNKPVGFSKIMLDAKHPNMVRENVTKLDRIYLLKEYYGLKLGLALLNFNIELSRNNNQTGMWLYTWIGNQRAIDFYLKAGFTIIGSHKFQVTKTHYDLCHQMFLNFPEAKVQQLVLTACDENDQKFNVKVGRKGLAFKVVSPDSLVIFIIHFLFPPTVKLGKRERL